MPLTLLCGHSICSKCFRTHSDPKSADSLVFCEECKIETKNKSLRESKVVGDICSGFSKIMAGLDDSQITSNIIKILIITNSYFSVLVYFD
jgi:hypothetical protein